MVSAVSPDCETKIHRVFSSMIGSPYLNSEAAWVKVGIPVKRSIILAPERQA